MTAITKRMRFEIFRRDNHACRYCGKTAAATELTIDHVMPVSLGGTSEPSNLVTACRDCNAGKSASSPDAALIANVAADEFRWAAAMRRAAEIYLREFSDRRDIIVRFEEHWCKYGTGYGKNRRYFPTDPGWEDSIARFVSSGLPMEILFECVDKAMAAAHIPYDAKFRYTCGIAWKRVRELRETAKALLETDDEDA